MPPRAAAIDPSVTQLESARYKSAAQLHRRARAPRQNGPQVCAPLDGAAVAEWIAGASWTVSPASAAQATGTGGARATGKTAGGS